ncbi:hypothetical protein BGX31_007743 [Mortierella sp. GBA43]|nr:hypothetical protein BGX31_007743 [Mortierella sp. GBA43]
MDTPKVMAIDLPEIRTAMGQFLGTSDLAIAAMVCRSWNASFTPILYSVINWSTRGKNPSRESIIANAGYIRRLDLTIGTYTKDGEFWYSDRQLRFQSLRWLYLVVESSLSARHQIEIIRKCPELKELNWYNFGSMSSLGSNSYVSSCLSPTMFQVVDVSELFAMHCPNVERLTLHGGARSDEDLSRILDNCRRVTELTATPSSFKELTIRSLSRHFEHIERLDINRSGLTSKMAQHILTNCPNLNYFHGVTLEAQDILGATEYNVMGVEHPQAWVCSRLASLTIFICGLDKKPRDWHRRVFHQLSKMKRFPQCSRVVRRFGFEVGCRIIPIVKLEAASHIQL